MTTTHQWDRHAILAEISRRGSNLTKLALSAGLSAGACRIAMCRHLPSAEMAISNFLGVPVYELWPDRYPASTKPNRSIAKHHRLTSRKRDAA